jgi:DNA-binding PadR family transcriptional regulator
VLTGFDKRHISAYKFSVRRKPGTLLPLEQAICASAAALLRRGTAEFHGYELAKRLAHGADRQLLTAYGTLYRALGRLEAMRLLESRREDPEIAARENRPGRRLYRLTAAGEAAARKTSPVPAKPRRRVRRGTVPA